MKTNAIINKAYQIVLKRINASSQFINGWNDTFDSEHGCTTRFFWNEAQPGFERIKNKYNSIKLSLVFGSRITYGASICDNTNNPILCLLNEDDFANVNSWLKYSCTMRMRNGISNDDFKRIWLMTALSSGKDLYKLGHAGKPFLKAGETIESLAIEYDLSK